MTVAAAGVAARNRNRLPTAITGLSQQNSDYRRVLAVCDQVADAALNGATAVELTRVFARVVDKAVVLLDPAFAVRACVPDEQAGAMTPLWNPKESGNRRLLRALASEHRPLRVPAMPDSGIAHGCLGIPIEVGGTSLGYLLVLDDVETAEPDDVDLLIASYASTLFALTLAHEKTSTDLGLRYQAAVVDALVSGHFLDFEEARQKALTLGLDDGQPYRIALFRVVSRGEAATGSLSSLREIIEELVGPLTGCTSGAVLVARGADLVMILPGEPERVNEPDHARGLAASVLAKFASMLRARSITGEPACGLSASTRRPDDAPHRLQQAEHAINLGFRLGRAGEVISYEGLGIYRLLLQIGDMQKLWRFAEDTLGPLIKYDATHKSELVRTLSVYLAEHASLKQAARKLRVHANTVTYRVHRIEQLTPLDLGDPDDRLNAHVAVKIVESHRSGMRLRGRYESFSDRP